MIDVEAIKYVQAAKTAGTIPCETPDIIDPLFRDQCLTEAILAAQLAYCPYSNFHVGAAVITQHGQVFAGCNVENAAYGSTICAERNAITTMIANCGPATKIQEVTIWCPTPTPVPPCGACRQVIREFAENMDIRIWSYCADPTVNPLGLRLDELLPFSFGPENL